MANPGLDEAKKAIIKPESGDPELEVSIQKGRNKQLELAREQNRHNEQVQHNNLGIFGRIFGTSCHLAEHAALSVLLMAFLILLIIIVFIVFAEIADEKYTFLSEFAKLMVGIISTALAYIFGKSGNSK